MDRTLQLIEGLLFLSGEQGITFSDLREICKVDDQTLEKALDMIKDHYSGRGFHLMQFGSCFKFICDEAVLPYARTFYVQKQRKSLSQAAMETLAIIAYNQPVSRMQIEAIRGVNCESSLKNLLSNELIMVEKKENSRLNFYCTTQKFLETFYLKDLDDLPKSSKLDRDLYS